jgi:hypothetical protein
LLRDEDQGTGSGNRGDGVWERGKQGLGTRRTRLGTRRTGSGGEKDGIGNKVRGKPVIEVAQTITVPGCSTGLGIIFVKLRGTRILIEGDSRFYIQPEVGRVNDGWLLSSILVIPFECISIASSECTSIAPSTRMSIVT